MVDKSNKIFKLITSRLRVNFTQRTNVQFHISNANSGSSYYLWQNFNDMQTQILEHRQIQQKIVRIAYEIIEELAEIEEIHVVGIIKNGEVLADLLVAEMQKISTQTFFRSTIELDKDFPLQKPISHTPKQNLEGASVVLIDDVINSGKTIQYALNHLLLQPVRQVKTVTLVDRKHRRFPIHADFVGLQLSTTMQERVEVSFEGSWSAYLV